MDEQDGTTEIQRLGGLSEGRVQKYFCLEEEGCHAFSRISKDAEIVKREPLEIMVMGKPVKGWIVELLVPATDGTVRMDPMASQGWNAFRSMGE